MKSEKVDSLRPSFEYLEKGRQTFARRFYQRLFAADPELAQLFDGTDLKQQGYLLVESLRLAVEAFEDRDRDDLAKVLEGLGFRHAQYGVKAAHYPIFVRGLLDTIYEQLKLSTSTALGRRWRDCLDFLTCQMLAGALRAKESDVEEEPDHEPTHHSYETVEAQRASEDYLERFLSEEPQDPEWSQLSESAPPLPLMGCEIHYEGYGTVKATPQQTVLDVSLIHGIPHICECGGKARCSTCRVLIVDGGKNCLPRNSVEKRLAKIKGFPGSVRLACQTRITGPVTVRRLVLDEQDIDTVVVERGIAASGREMKLAILFADLRGFTEFADGNLPYDVVHALNRYFGSVCEAIDRNRGFVDKFIGDGIMAIFGLQGEQGAHPAVDAVRASLDMLRQMAEVNTYVKKNFNYEFRIGIGIAFGSVVIGKVGFRLKRQFTAIGDVVNVASRVESQTKTHHADLLVTDSVRKVLAEDLCRVGRQFTVRLAGKQRPQKIYEILEPEHDRHQDGPPISPEDSRPPIPA